MSDLENKKTEETPKKRPYNLREKKEMEQDTGNYTYDFFTFRNVLISAVVLGVIILVISLVR